MRLRDDITRLRNGYPLLDRSTLVLDVNLHFRKPETISLFARRRIFCKVLSNISRPHFGTVQQPHTLESGSTSAPDSTSRSHDIPEGQHGKMAGGSRSIVAQDRRTNIGTNGRFYGPRVSKCC